MNKKGKILTYVTPAIFAVLCGSASAQSIRIEAEDYWEKMGDLKAEPTTDVGGGENIGFIKSMDSLGYADIGIPSTGKQTARFRVASKYSGGYILISEGSVGTAGDSGIYRVDIPNYRRLAELGYSRNRIQFSPC